jgi:hypothetical protein
MTTYDYRNCQSLFGYAAAVHERSGGVCQLCGCGARELDFDLWRQMTVEHLIGESQGGYLAQIRTALAARWPGWDERKIDDLARRIDAANTVTACSFCNSTTSRNRTKIDMREAIERAPHGTPEEIFQAVTGQLADLLLAKRNDVAWKLEAVKLAFAEKVKAQASPSARRTEVDPTSSSGCDSRFRVTVPRSTTRDAPNRESRSGPDV